MLRLLLDGLISGSNNSLFVFSEIYVILVIKAWRVYGKIFIEKRCNN